MEVKGKIKVINDTQVVSDKFSKREIVVTTDETYPQDVLIQFTQDKCGILDNYSVGQHVSVSINLRGREWTSPQGEVKYFNTIEGWRIEEAVVEGRPDAQPIEGISKEETNDLPF